MELTSLKGIELAKQLAWLVVLTKNNDFESCQTATQNFYSTSRAIADKKLIQTLHSLPLIHEIIYDSNLLLNFENAFSPWLLAHKTNSIKGLEEFEPDISQGSTQAFDSFFLKHFQREICFFQGEYLYHILSCQRLNRPWSMITDFNQITEKMALVISVPFCDTGNVPNQFKKILDHCDQLGVPVLLDCSYFTIANKIHLDLRHECIDTIAFSLSKTFPVAHARVGMRYTRIGWQDGQKLHKNINYNNRLTACVGLHLIQQYTSDYISVKYKPHYDYLVNLLGLSSSDTVIFANGNSDWQDYGRKVLIKSYGLNLDHKLFRNRICLTQLLENIDLISTVTCR